MSAINNGGPAFPVDTAYQGDGSFGHQTGSTTWQFSGVTVRDYFAAKAMQAAATNPAGADGFTFEERAVWAYAQADAMLKAREA